MASGLSAIMLKVSAIMLKKDKIYCVNIVNPMTSYCGI